MDICLCSSAECEKYNSCVRGGATKRVGVYTTSLLAEICNEESNYSEYIGVKEYYGTRSC